MARPLVGTYLPVASRSVDGLVLVGVRSSALSALLIKEGGCSDILVGRSLETELIEHVSSGFLAGVVESDATGEIGSVGLLVPVLAVACSVEIVNPLAELRSVSAIPTIGMFILPLVYEFVSHRLEQTIESELIVVVRR